jgi:hypothetical protein
MSDIEDVVDEFVDTLDPESIEGESERLGITVDELLRLITIEVKARLA